MSAINVTSVQVLDNPQMFSSPLQFEIQYECLQDLRHDLEWKLTYVGSAEDDEYDQVLDTVLVGPVVRGAYKFVFQANPPDVSKIPAEDILGVTVLLVTCSYNNEEFIRVGYYVNNEYADEELREDPPSQPRLDRVMRNILADKPRVTRFPCDFDAQAIPGMENVASEDAMMGDENQEVQQGGMGVDFSKDQAGFFQQQQAPGQTQGLW
ncbi:Histone chaperone, ASF1-like [Ostreococcus tauri]|uniref:Histone chaperone, ASF1-like n=1 Tax=Ostreococcus tauri TaxID=70448 RepID=A0A090LZX5_OSTTA|nr:Histone chaperone, ASF1-like [Ostreococcus tauri]CEF97570.1 Histone chaperone, ASF1-like [Ostreococcus tauri]|eukprot:XP_022838761.1 Histone chaperone, ASF1-like [Ostreococcus tauri]